MKKTYILDTNVLIQAPYAVSCFEDNDVIIPLKVVEELDGLKKADGEKGACARQAVRILEQMRQQGDLLAGVPVKDGGILRIETNYTHVELPKDLLTEKADNRILQVCKGLQEEKQIETLILVTKDIVMRLKAQLLGIKAEDFSTEQISEQDKEYTGRTEAYIPDKYIKDFKKQGISVKKLYWSDEEGNRKDVQVFENEFILLKSDVGNRRTLLGKIRNGKAYPLEYKKKKPYDISPRNMGQYFLQEALMAPASEIPLVIVQGMAGTAKTFYSLAVGLEKVYNNPTGEYRRIIVCRPNAQFDDDIGFLPVLILHITHTFTHNNINHSILSNQIIH